MNAQQLMADDKQYLANTYGRFDLVIERGKGATLWDAEGKKYIDLSSGIGVNALGYADEGWIRAVTKQMGKLSHMSNLYYTEPGVTLAKLLCGRTGMDKVFFCNSGAEANEGAIKCARKYSMDKYGSGRHKIVSLSNSFHGRTMATLSATGQEVFHKNFHPFLEGFAFASPNDAPATLAQLGNDVCAIILELIQGEGGVMPLDPAYVEAVASHCKEHDILLVVDEVQTGAGRTGKFLCCEHYGLCPDIVTMAKGLGGGLPIGAVLMNKNCSSVLGPGDHATTFGANPLACAGGAEVLARLDDALLDSVAEKGAYIRHALEKLPMVLSVDGMGFMLGIRLADGIAARDVVEEGIRRGIVPLTAKAKVRLLPPLVITWKELEEAVHILEQTLSALSV